LISLGSPCGIQFQSLSLKFGVGVDGGKPQQRSSRMELGGDASAVGGDANALGNVSQSLSMVDFCLFSIIYNDILALDALLC
jgi:hypothetical protein